MLKRSFVNRQESAISLLYRPADLSEALSLARNAYTDGADGIAIEISLLEQKLRTEENFRTLFSCVPLPFMVINYRNDIVWGNDDAARQKDLLTAAEAGADVIDVMGDLFDPSPRELTRNPDAIAKQKDLIEEIHAKGSHVLISSHATVEKCLPAEEVLSMMQLQSARGADLLKVVVRTETEEELLEGMKTLLLLKKELDKPFIYLGTGTFGKFLRYIGPKFGVAVEFAVHDYPPGTTYITQPAIRSMRKVLDNLFWEF